MLKGNFSSVKPIHFNILYYPFKKKENAKLIIQKCRNLLLPLYSLGLSQYASCLISICVISYQ